MKELYIAAVAVKRGDIYYMQHRTGDPSIGAAGLIGFFGGKIEDEETPEAAARRELSEESDLTFSDQPLKEIGKVSVVSDYKNQPVDIRMTIFDLELSEGVELGAKEGEVVTMTKQEMSDNLDKLTPGTKAFFEKYIGGK